MSSFRKLRSVLIGLALPLIVAACHVGALNPDSGGSTTTTPKFAAEGLWTGTDTTSLQTVTAIVDSNGKADFILADGVEFTGTIDVSGSTVAAGVDGYANYGSTFNDGTTYGVGTLSGTVTESETMNLTLDFTTSGNTAIDSTWNLTYLTLSTSGAALTTLAGSYTDAVTGATVTISSDGVMLGQSATTGWSGCVLSGTVTVPDANYDVYDVTYSYSSCTGTWAALNGVSFSGLALLNSNNSPNQIIMGVSGKNASDDEYSIVTTLNRG